MTKGQPYYGASAPPPPNGYNQSGYGYNSYGDQYNAGNNQYQSQDNNQNGQQQQQQHIPQYGQTSSGYQYDQANTYQNQPAGQWTPGTPQEQQQQQYYSYPPTHGPEVEQFKSHFDHPSAQQGHSHDYYNPPQQYGQPQGQPQGQTEDRGVLGAMGGAAAGGFAGHKLGHHGILGAIGGAIAGSLLEDQHKKHKKDDKHKKEDKHKHKKRDHSPEHLGNFSHSSTGIWLEHDQYLVADCRDVHGHPHQSRIDLNDLLGNDNGEFRWVRHGNFMGSAKDVKLKDDGTKLKAKLATVDGDWEEDSIKLNERIGNDNGRLFFID